MPYKAGSYNDLTVIDKLDVAHKRIQNVGDPIKETDAATKQYVDSQAKASIAVGEGLEMDGHAISLQSPIAVALGGTGSRSFPMGSLLFGNGTNHICATDSLSWDVTKARLQSANIHSDAINTKQLYTVEFTGIRCGVEKATFVNLVSQEGVIEELECSSLSVKGRLKSHGLTNNFVVETLNSATGTKVTMGSILHGVIVRSGQEEQVVDTLPSVKDAVESLCVETNQAMHLTFFFINQGDHPVTLMTEDLNTEPIVVAAGKSKKLDVLCTQHALYISQTC
jgi:hypothetical protein